MKKTVAVASVTKTAATTDAATVDHDIVAGSRSAITVSTVTRPQTQMITKIPSRRLYNQAKYRYPKCSILEDYENLYLGTLTR